MIESLVNFVTTTSYASWLPGDARGYIQRGELLPASPALEQHAHSLLKQRPILFTHDERDRLERALLAACDEFGYRLFDLSIESWHLHWIVRHNDDANSMIGRLKSRMRQELNRGRIWTKGYWRRELRTEEQLLIARQYIRRHPGCRIIDGNAIHNQESPGGAGG
jgi:REP element-mobilizing transposase RayT